MNRRWFTPKEVARAILFPTGQFLSPPQHTDKPTLEVESTNEDSNEFYQMLFIAIVNKKLGKGKKCLKTC